MADQKPWWFADRLNWRRVFGFKGVYAANPLFYLDIFSQIHSALTDGPGAVLSEVYVA
ncbi:MAG: hypothetical protein P8Z77_16145 [Candidatus Thiodiazotropha sp.]